MPVDRLKKALFEAATKFMSSERGVKLMQNAKLMQTIAKIFEFRSNVKSNVDTSLKTLHTALGLATRDDFDGLKRVLREVELRLNDLKSQADDLESSVLKIESTKAEESKTGKRRGRGDKVEA